MNFWKSKQHKARKIHWCELCLGQIKSGLTYERQIGMFDGEFQVLTFHVECAKVIDKIKAHPDWCGDGYIDEYQDFYQDYKQELNTCQTRINGGVE